MKKFIPTRLYIKIHTKTKLKYFGKSIKKDIEKYTGSGKRWLNHINKHGKQHIVTIWISDYFYSEKDIKKFALEFSEQNNIKNSNEWANLKEENGLDGGKLPENSILSIKEKLTGRNKNTHKYIELAALKKSKTMKDPKGKYQQQGRQKIENWLNSLSPAERKEKLGHIVTQEQKNKLSKDRIGKTKNNNERVYKMSLTKKEHFQNMSLLERKEKLGHSKGRKWFHNDEIKKSKTFHIENVPNGWKLGRKKYEN